MVMKPAPIDPPEVTDTLWAGVTGTHGWDVGANCGQTIPLMLDRFHHVAAFEPAEECWPYLDKLAENHPALTIEHFGLSDQDTDVDLIALPDKIDTGQLVTAGTHGMEWNPDSASGLIRTVACRTVDNLTRRKKYPPPDFLKIDVEGHELTEPSSTTQTDRNSHGPPCTDDLDSLDDAFTLPDDVADAAPASPIRDRRIPHAKRSRQRAAHEHGPAATHRADRLQLRRPA
jgi:FkbM family methyltransferase